MKVCLIGTLPDAGREAHKGPERTTIGLGEALDARGHDIVVVSDEGDAETIDVCTRIIGEDLAPGVDRLVRFYRKVQEKINLNSFDVIHSWRPAPNVDIFSTQSVDAAETVQNRLPGTFSHRYRLGAKFEILGKRFTASQADRNIVTAVPNVVDATNHGIEPDRVIPVGVDKSFIQPNEEIDSNVQVLCVGRLEPRKNQAFPAAYTPDKYTLQLVGPNTGDYAENVEEFEERWEGKVSAEGLMRSYREADVLVLPSVFEGFGLTAVEAMSAGTPVVVADSCGVSEHIYDNPVGEVYRFGDPASYRRCLEKVVENRKEYGEKAREYVRENLTWGIIAAQYEREYQRIVESKD